MQVLLGKHWHHLPESEVVNLLDTDPQKGLDLFEIRHRQQHFGANALTPRKGKSPLVRFLLQFHNPLIYILLASSVITAVVKDALDAATIFGVVLVNAIIGYIQEARAEKAIEALAKAMTTEANVLREGGILKRIPAEQLVPGDIVVLKAGDKVPADLRLLRTRDLQVAEAALTGESMPVHKDAGVAMAVETLLAERKNMAYASTLVTYGQGTGVVTAIGDATEIGRISQLISEAQSLQTPLTRKMAAFSKILLYAILALAAVSFGIGVLRGQDIIETLTAAIALAVAMIPEGLPAALTVTLAIGVSRIAKRRAIIRKLPAVETLGSLTVICSDKTGTLTQNQMTVQKIVAANGEEKQATGVGYDPNNGEIVDIGGEVPLQGGAFAEILRAGLLCNDSSLENIEGRWEAIGDPTEVALIVSARKAGFDAVEEGQKLPRIDTIPFESQYQYMATLHNMGEANYRRVYVKGSVEALLERASCALDSEGKFVELDKAMILGLVDQMAGRGLRVLAFARRDLAAEHKALRHEDVAEGLVFLGLQGMIDPPRPEAIEAVRACQGAGIQVKMITGDHALTAAAIAKELCLGQPGKEECEMPSVLTGKQLAAMNDRELVEAAAKTSVFARVSPEQKLKLVEALQAQGGVVSMTGDGVNDGPALKQANVGVAMGITGTDVAKEAADMVLTDDNFATIAAAVEEGRGVYDNLTKIIAWTLPTNLGEGLIILAALLLGVVLPILPIQILWINMVTVATLGLALAMERIEPGIMKRPPRPPEAPILTRTLAWRVVLVSIIILAGAFGLFELELELGRSVAEARTVAVNVVIVVEIFYLLNCRSLSKSPFAIGFFTNRWALVGILAMVALMMLFTYAPFMNTIFSSAPIDLITWGEILGVGLIGYLVVEVEKWLRSRRQGY